MLESGQTWLWGKKKIKNKNQLTSVHINIIYRALHKIHFRFLIWSTLDLRCVGLVWSWQSLGCDVLGLPSLLYMPMLKACSSWWKCWVGSDKTMLDSRQGCQTRPRPRETSLTRLWTGSPSTYTGWSGSKSMLSSETVRTRRLEPRSREMATKLWDHTV